MGYYLRVFGKTNPNITISVIQELFKHGNLDATIEVEDGTNEDWSVITVCSKEGNPIVRVERLSTNDTIGYEELMVFEEEIEEYKPRSAVEWLQNFFKKVAVIYTFEVFDFSDNSYTWQILGKTKIIIMKTTKGIAQADHEGFSNDEGDHILWQFSDQVEGGWNMAVLNSSNNWVKFRMDLGNEIHRAAFQRGEIPSGIRPVTG